MSDEELIAIVEQADQTMTPGTWHARWGGEPGHVTGPNGSLLLDTYDETEADRPNSLGIVALRNNAGAIVRALRRLTQERDAANSKVIECCMEGTRVTNERNAAQKELAAARVTRWRLCVQHSVHTPRRIDDRRRTDCDCRAG